MAFFGWVDFSAGSYSCSLFRDSRVCELFVRVLIPSVLHYGCFACRLFGLVFRFCLSLSCSCNALNSALFWLLRDSPEIALYCMFPNGLDSKLLYWALLAPHDCSDHLFHRNKKPLIKEEKKKECGWSDRSYLVGLESSSRSTSPSWIKLIVYDVSGHFTLHELI